MAHGREIGNRTETARHRRHGLRVVSAADIAALDAFAVANGLPLPTIGAVPEPASAGLVLLAGTGMLLRRQRRGSATAS